VEVDGHRRRGFKLDESGWAVIAALWPEPESHRVSRRAQDVPFRIRSYNRDFEGFALPSKLLHSMKSRRIVPPRAFGGLRSATLTCVAIPRELKGLKDSIAAFFI